MTLLNHVDTTVRVTEEEVRAEPRPDFSKTWRPFSHAEIIDSVSQACSDLQLTITRKEYSIRKDSKMFASWEVNSIEGIKADYKEMSFSIGIRNSIDKTHSLGFCAGKRVFVCDNLIFSGDFIVFRKHTGALELGEIQILAKESLEALIPKFKELNVWHRRMKKIRLTDEQAALLACAAMKREIVPASKYPQFHELYFDKNTKYSPTLHGFHGACTELMMNNSLLTIHWKNEQLNRFLNFEAPLLVAPRRVARVDFAAKEKNAEVIYAMSRKNQKLASRVTSQQIRKKAVQELKERKKEEKETEKLKLKIKGIGQRPKPKDKAPEPTPAPPKKRMHVTDLDECSRKAVFKKKIQRAGKEIQKALKEKEAEQTSKTFHALAAAAKKQAQKDIAGKKKKQSKKRTKGFVLDNGKNEARYGNDLRSCPYCKAWLAPKDKVCLSCGKSS